MGGNVLYAAAEGVMLLFADSAKCGCCLSLSRAQKEAVPWRLTSSTESYSVPVSPTVSLLPTLKAKLLQVSKRLKWVCG